MVDFDAEKNIRQFERYKTNYIKNTVFLTGNQKGLKTIFTCYLKKRRFPENKRKRKL